MTIQFDSILADLDARASIEALCDALLVRADREEELCSLIASLASLSLGTV